jgi:putative endonuclease
MLNTYFVYILASKRNGTLYIGVTNDIEDRVFQHKVKLNQGFSNSYNATRLVHYEEFDDPDSAIHREKRLKKWNRVWKVELIEKRNPQWKDLSEGWYGAEEFEFALRTLDSPVKPWNDKRESGE